MPNLTAARTQARANLANLLWNAATGRADHPAIVAAGTTTTYESLRDRAAAIAAAAAANGVEPDDRVGIFLSRGVDAAAAVFGVMALGAVPVVINDRMRPRQAEYVLRHSGARALVTSREMLRNQPRPIESESIPLLTEEIPAGDRRGISPAARGPSDLAQLVYTSGSTGMPKGVIFTHGSVAAGLQSCLEYLGTAPEDRVASLLPFSSVYGLNQLLSTVATGATLLVETSPVPQQLVESLRDGGVTVLAGVPPLWLQLLSAPAFTGGQIPTLRQMQNAGGHLPVHATRALRAAQPRARLYLQYGMTETFRGTYLPPEEVDRRPGSMGHAVPGAEIMVLSDDLAECAPGEIGELVHAGASVSAGYWNDPDATRRVFRPHPLRPEAGQPVVYSGDMVRRDDEGFLHFVSRRDRLIKTLGFRVGPDEIADVLFASGHVRECLVTAEPDHQRGDRIVAYVVLTAAGDLPDVTKFARMELPRHMQPGRIEAVESIPRLASGKYDVAALTGRSVEA